MWPVIGAVLAGALLARRSKAQTRILKSKVIGARSGREWCVEYIADTETMIVFGRSSRVAFQRDTSGWKATLATGNANEVSLIRKDFES